MGLGIQGQSQEETITDDNMASTNQNPFKVSSYQMTNTLTSYENKSKFQTPQPNKK